jgi:uncharacterized protein involved in exopolysaccharide biosynthesis
LGKHVDWKRYLRVIWSGKGIVLLCTVSALCAVLVMLTRIPRTYESNVVLMLQEEQVLATELGEVMGRGGRAPASYGSEDERIAQLMGRIRSDPFLERVVLVMKVNEDPFIRSEAEKQRGKHPGLSLDQVAIRVAVGSLRSRIRFKSSGQGVYRISVADRTAEGAQALAKWITKLFVDTSSQTALDRLRVEHRFATDQVRVYEQRLRQSELELDQYRQSMISGDRTRGLVREDNLERAEALSREILREEATARIRLRTCSAAVTALWIGMDDAFLRDDPEIRDLAAGLTTALQSEIAGWLKGDRDPSGEWPPPRPYRALQGDLLRHVETAVVRLYPDAGGDAVTVAARFLFARIDLEAQSEAAAMLTGAIAALRQQAESVPRQGFDLSRLEESVAANRSLLQSFRDQLIASDVSQAVATTKLSSHFQILDPATLPLAQSYPNRSKIAIASLILGALLGIGLIFLRETQDMTLRSLEDFAGAIPEPILGTTLVLGRFSHRRSWVRRHWIPATLGGVLLLTAAFFLARTDTLHDLVTAGRPVQMVSPERPPDENQ